MQSEDPKGLGYTPKKDSEYCQRCFRLLHYDDLTVSMRKGIDPDMVMHRIADMDCLVLWVVDLFDFEGSMIPGLQRKLMGKDIVMVAAKRDILPSTLSADKAARFIFSRLKEFGIHIKGLVQTGRLEKEGIDDVMEAVRMFSKGRPIAVMGRANAGKSTLLNHLMGKNILTSSRYPGTTLEFNTLEIQGYTFIDTPGIEIENSMLNAVHEEDLKQILPSSTISAQIYQISGDQSFAIGGLVRVDLLQCDHATAAVYISRNLPIHRGKAASADDLWKKHYGEMFRPVPLENKFVKHSFHKNMDKLDAVIDGLGWICISSQVSDVIVYAPENVNVTFRKGML